MLSDVTTSGALPTLEALMRFAGARHRIIASNVANITTPNYIQKDVSVKDFQNTLSEAIRARREDTGGMTGALKLESTPEVTIGDDGRMDLDPQLSTGGILGHDRNNSSIERLMQDHAENVGVFRMASELLRSRMALMRDAIAERV